MKAPPGSLWCRVKSWVSSLAPGRAANGLSITARLDVGSKKSLLVVGYGERRFLVGMGAETVSAILEIDARRRWGTANGRDGRALRSRRAGPGAARGRFLPAHGGLPLQMSRAKR